MSTHSTAKLVRSVSEHDHVRGPATAPVTLVEYGDYECPHCGLAFPIVEALRKWAGDNLRFVYRHFPLTQLHPCAESAAESAEAAGACGKFWEMHEQLYAHQEALDVVNLARYAAAIGLDEQEVAAELATHQFQDRVRGDFVGGARSGVNGTPTFFINGVRYDGMPDFDSLSAALEQAADLNRR